MHFNEPFIFAKFQLDWYSYLWPKMQASVRNKEDGEVENNQEIKTKFLLTRAVQDLGIAG